MEEKKLINEEELENVSGGVKESTEEWFKNKDVREAAWELVKPYVEKYNLGYDYAKYEVAKAIWYWEIPGYYVEDFILAHCVYKKDI